MMRPLLLTVRGPLRERAGQASAVRAGDWAETSRVLDADVVAAFARATGDANPIHDGASSSTTRFGGRAVAHGSLCASAFPAVFAECFPGAVYLSQTLKFLRPVFVGSTIEARVTVTGVENRRRLGFLLTCDTHVTVDSVRAVDGVATVLVNAANSRDGE